jgi:thiamine pyrophosphate-dependent acetolactate synthase large subunit-like protein/CDGSH-type Zn-finger protein/nitrite reductase/ring-hydroxylating ferredoxin subunit
MSDESRPSPSIKPLKDGPFKVSGLERFTNSRGEHIDAEPEMYLCRCGHSHTKPFCDNTHEAVGFSGEKDPGRVPDRRDDYEGAGVTIHDNRGICSHAGLCTDCLPEVFGRGEPWVDADGAPADRVAEVVDMCPSGALAYTRDGVTHRDHDAGPEVHVSQNGPYWVKGGVELTGEDLGGGASPEHYTLCRCGASKNKPRCDGSHWYADFRDDEARTISAAHRQRERREAEWVKVAAPGQPAPGEKLTARVGSEIVVISRVGDAVGAIAGSCPHQGGPLHEGSLEDGVIRCPWHGHAFDALTGRAHGADHDVPAYETEERDDGVYLKAERPARSEWTVSHVVAESMVAWGIRHVFGMVGHSNLGLAEAIRIQEERGTLTYIGIRHEGAAAFACSGYAKASGRPAACLSIAGPGATNLLTGLWDAKMDRAPALALTGQVQTQVLGPGAFQEIDLPAAFDAVSTFSQTVLTESDWPELVSLALKHAVVDRDVAHLIFPDEIQRHDAGLVGPSSPDGRLGSVQISPAEQEVSLALHRIRQARRPLIIVGFGARDAMPDVLALAELLQCPVATTFKAKGQLPDSHPLAAGVLGRSGTPIASGFMNDADLLVVFGSSFSQHTGIDAGKPIIQVDFDRMTLGKFHRVAQPLWGEIGVTARLLREKLAGLRPVDMRAEVAEAWRAWRAEKARRAALDNGRGLPSAEIFRTLSDALPEDALLAVDVGDNTYSFGRYFEARRQRVIMSGYLGSIGFSFPAAIGARMALPDRPVVSIGGDGGFGQYMGEFTTAVKYSLDMTHVLLNNGELGKISKEQRAGGWEVWQTSLQNPGFAAYARECGGFGVRVTERDALADAVAEALAYEGPSMVEVVSDPELI